MKKCTLGAGILTAMMLFSPIAEHSVDASNLASASTQQTVKKFMWGANELADSQVGRLVFTKDVKVYKRDGNGAVQFHMNAKKGSMWRVHKITKEGKINVYDLGAGVRVQQSSLSTYEAAPKDLIAKQVKENGVLLLWGKNRGLATPLEYPQIHKLASEDIKNKVNKLIEDNANWIAHGALGDNAEVKYSVVENKNNRLVLSLTVSTEDSETGAESTKVYTNKYNLVTGDLIE